MRLKTRLASVGAPAAGNLDTESGCKILQPLHFYLPTPHPRAHPIAIVTGVRDLTSESYCISMRMAKKSCT